MKFYCREHLETCAGEQPRDITPQASSTQGKPPLEIEKYDCHLYLYITFDFCSKHSVVH